MKIEGKSLDFESSELIHNTNDVRHSGNKKTQNQKR